MLKNALLDKKDKAFLDKLKENNKSGSKRRFIYESLLELFISFFKNGLFTFGGGYAMLPMFERELV